MLNHTRTTTRLGTNQSSPAGILTKWKSAWIRTLWPRDAASLAIHDFAQTLEETREAAEVQVALLRQAYQLSGATCVELWSENDHHPRPIACWPEPPSGESARITNGQDAGDWLRIPIRVGGKTQGTLRLKARPRTVWSPYLIRTLSTLASMANAAERAFRNDRLADLEATHDSISGLYNNTFLQAFLNHTTHQAQRRHEAVSLLYIGIDRLEAIERLHGPEVTVQATRLVAATILRTLRSSDVIGRLDDGRLVAVLPNASAADSLDVAEALCKTIAEAGQPTTNMPVLTASIGVATYPNHAHDVSTLRAAAAAALARAQSQGRNRVVETTAMNPMSTLALVTAAS